MFLKGRILKNRLSHAGLPLNEGLGRRHSDGGLQTGLSAESFSQAISGYVAVT